jgi:hypothetical protein
MCQPYSEVIGALIGELSGIALLLTVGRTFVASAPTSPGASIGILVIRVAVLGAITSPFALGAWWTVRTWKHLWRCGRSPWERAVYDYGVRFIGIFTVVGQFFILTWLGWISDAGVFFGPLMMGGALAALFLARLFRCISVISWVARWLRSPAPKGTRELTLEPLHT